MTSAPTLTNVEKLDHRLYGVFGGKVKDDSPTNELEPHQRTQSAAFQFQVLRDGRLDLGLCEQTRPGYPHPIHPIDEGSRKEEQTVCARL